MNEDAGSGANEAPGTTPESESKATPRPNTSHTIFWVGIALTVVWVGLVAAWWWSDPRSITGLKPNEFGDFLGGTFAPVAFLWLVLGFWQQGQELRNSAEALWLQMEELRNSVDQQRDLVTATRDLRDADLRIHEERKIEEFRASQPMLTISQSGGGRETGTDQYRFSYRISNLGRPCTDVQVLVGGQLKRRVGRLDSGEHESFEVHARYEEEAVHECRVVWIDERNTPGAKLFRLTTGPGVRGIELVGSG